MRSCFSVLLLFLLVPCWSVLASWEESKEEVEKAIAAQLSMEHVRIFTRNIDAKWELKKWQLDGNESSVHLEFTDSSGTPITIKVPFDEAIMVCMPKVRISAGERLDASELELMAIPKKQLKAEYLRSAPADEWVVKRTLSPHKPISTKDLVKPIVISKGSEVRVLFSQGILSVESKAIALENGAENQVIKLRNQDSNKIITARVLKEGIALVN